MENCLPNYSGQKVINDDILILMVMATLSACLTWSLPTYSTIVIFPVLTLITTFFLGFLLFALLKNTFVHQIYFEHFAPGSLVGAAKWGKKAP